MINQNPDENKKLLMEEIISKPDQTMNEICQQQLKTDNELTINKRDRKKQCQDTMPIQSPLGSGSQNTSHDISFEYNLYQSNTKLDITPQDQINEKQDLTINKRLRRKGNQQQASEQSSLLNSQAKSDDTNSEYYYEVIGSNLSKQDELDDIGKISTSKQNGNMFLFNNSVSQHRLLSKQLEKMKSKCSLNAQLNKLESKKESNDCDDENDVEEDDDDEEAEYEEEEDENVKQKDEKLEFQQNQKSWKKKLANDYLILEILGNGGQGKVATFLDKNNNHIIALKEFARINEFERESKIYKFLQEHTDLHDYVNLMLDEDPNQRQIKLQMGSCNLYEMYVQMKNHNSVNKSQLSWEQDHLVKIFRQLLHGLIAFRRKNFFHGDIKPHNLMLFSVENVFNHYLVKYIDLGASGFETKDYYELYSDQFYHPEYLDMVVTSDYVLTDIEVNICEIYAIVRSIWIILCFEREDLNNFKANTDLEFGLSFINQKYPKLANLIQQVLDQKGNLDKIEQVIEDDEFKEQVTSPLNSLCFIDNTKTEENNNKQKFTSFDTNLNFLKLNDQMKELIQKIIQMKKEKFINEQSEDQLQELFEIFYSLGQDQRALEIFHQLEPGYENLFKIISLSETENTTKKKFTKAFIDNKVRVIKESVILLNEKGELDKAIIWNKRLLNLFSSGKWKDDREAIQQSIQYSILLNTKGDVMASLQMSKDARNRYKANLWVQSGQNKEQFKALLYKDTLYGYISQVIGRLYVEINSFSNGLKYLKQALQIFEAIKKDNENREQQNGPVMNSEVQYEDLNNMIQLTLIKLSQASLFLRHNNKALEFIDAAISLGKKMYGDRVNKQQASCLNIKSHILKQQNQDLQALELQNKCLEIRLKIHNQVDHRFISNSLNSIALLESKLGFHEQALLNLEQCYQMRCRLYHKNNPFHNQIISCLRNFGIIYQKMGDFQKAETYLLQALEMSTNSNDLFQKINSLKMIEKLYKQTHQNENYKKYQTLRIQAKQELYDAKRNYHHQQTDQLSQAQATQSKRKESSYADSISSPTIQSQLQSDDEQFGHNSNESKQLQKSNQKKIKKSVQSQEDALSLTHQDSIQMTQSFPIIIAQPANKKANSNKSKNKRYSNIKTNIPGSKENQIETPKPRPKYKKKTRNLSNQQIIEENISENKQEEPDKAGLQQLLESQPIKDQILEKKNYKKNGIRRNSKKKSQHLKTQSEIGDNNILDENMTIQRKKVAINDEDMDLQMITKKVIRNKQQSESLTENESLIQQLQKGKPKSQNQDYNQDDQQKASQSNIKSSQNNKNPKNLIDQVSDRRSINKPKGGYQKYQKYKHTQNKLMKDNFQDQEYIEVIQKEDKLQPKKESLEEKIF